ncbi:MAG: hypothetical protein EON59_10135, partial [Alphaproteobacteria bacterium]
VMISKISSDVHLSHILFGDVLGIGDSELWQTVIAGAIALTVTLLLRKDLLLYVFDPTHARSIGLNTGVLRTLGADGAEAFANGAYILVPAMRVEVRDTSAAGDCFIGVLASALDRGLPLKAAMTRATIAAGIACSRAGSQDSIPLRAETDLAVADL